MKTLVLSGWGQPHDALASLLPDATHLPYAHHDSLEGALSAIAKEGQSHDMIVGWSLGGQLAVRAIGAGLVRPKKLVLIAAPFQFVAKDAKDNLGMGPATFQKFRDNYAKNPVRTLDKSWELVAYDDARADQVRAQLFAFDKQAVIANDWLKWLDRLENHSLHDLPMNHFPPTLIIQGEKDAVVSARQAQHFAHIIPQSKLILMPQAGHAPHWHDPRAVARHIKEHGHV